MLIILTQLFFRVLGLLLAQKQVHAVSVHAALDCAGGDLVLLAVGEQEISRQQNDRTS